MSKINADHEDDAQAGENSEAEAEANEAEQNSQVSPYGTPTEPAEEQELNFGG